MKIKDLDFRIWHNTLNLFVGFPCVVKGRDYLLIPKYDDDLEIELWTGFYDKTGVRIFEGDIMSFKDESGESIGKVLFDDGFSLIIKNHYPISLFEIFFEAQKGQPNSQRKRNISTLEVIGNIHENKELLEGGE